MFLYIRRENRSLSVLCCSSSIKVNVRWKWKFMWVWKFDKWPMTFRRVESSQNWDEKNVFLSVVLKEIYFFFQWSLCFYFIFFSWLKKSMNDEDGDGKKIHQIFDILHPNHKESFLEFFFHSATPSLVMIFMHCSMSISREFLWGCADFSTPSTETRKSLNNEINE